VTASWEVVLAGRKYEGETGTGEPFATLRRTYSTPREGVHDRAIRHAKEARPAPPAVWYLNKLITASAGHRRRIRRNSTWRAAECDQTGKVSVTVPSRLREVQLRNDGGQEWLDSIPVLVARAVERWDLAVGKPFEEGMAAWTAPATTGAGTEVVLKVSWPCRETRDEAAALAAWHGAGVVELLDADAADSALLLRRVRPGSTLRDARVPPIEHLRVGAELLRRMGAAPVGEGEPFLDLVEVAGGLAVAAAERLERLAPIAPIPIDTGLCRQGINLLRILPGEA
jgi:hypothetical protein